MGAGRNGQYISGVRCYDLGLWFISCGIRILLEHCSQSLKTVSVAGADHSNSYRLRPYCSLVWSSRGRRTLGVRSESTYQDQTSEKWSYGECGFSVPQKMKKKLTTCGHSLSIDSAHEMSRLTNWVHLVNFYHRLQIGILTAPCYCGTPRSFADFSFHHYRSSLVCPLQHWLPITAGNIWIMAADAS